MSGVDFLVPELNVTNLNTEVSGNFFQDAVLPTLTDMSHNIDVEVAKSSINKVFLFYSDDTNAGSLDSNDLSDFSNTDLKYAIHLEQWNPRIETTKIERKYVMANLLMDLFGGGSSEALANVDVFSNEAQLDNDISGIFHTRLSAQQRVNLSDAKHGFFSVASDLSLVVGTVITSAQSQESDAISAKLLEQAALHARNVNSNSTVFRRQFDSDSNSATYNSSNADYSLPTGWRTFQFVDGDTLSFNLIIKQPPQFFPNWSVNANALSLEHGGTDSGLVTKYRVKFTVRDTPSTGAASFATFNVPAS
tara:strand:- start:1127 stop:2044 length:918 start_codon:yes stop_codon:yes gene_type:complete